MIHTEDRVNHHAWTYIHVSSTGTINHPGLIATGA